MSKIHFLNVNEGDCSIIEHLSGHKTVIDVCNAKSLTLALAARPQFEGAFSGNFHQKRYPVNPISYMYNHGITSIFRYIQTHPDMDHMDGIEALFAAFKPINFWDTANTKEMPSKNWIGSPYQESDWQFYKWLRDNSHQISPRRLTLYSGDLGIHWTHNWQGEPGGDGLYVLAPTHELVAAANNADNDYNRCSYVILYRIGNNRIIFGGDSHDETWEHILDQHKLDVSNIDLLIAPHHGRRSGRSYDFLNILRPTLTFFGNARSQYLAYSAWHHRGLSIVTNNQANCMVVDTSKTPMTLYVTNQSYAQRVNQGTFYHNSFKAWYVGPITENLIP